MIDLASHKNPVKVIHWKHSSTIGLEHVIKHGIFVKGKMAEGRLFTNHTLGAFKEEVC